MSKAYTHNPYGGNPVNFRRLPDPTLDESTKVEGIPTGTPVTILHDQFVGDYTWYVVLLESDQVGWMREDVLLLEGKRRAQPNPISQLTTNIRGINIDLHNPTGFPSVNEVGAASYIRQLYNVSQGTGSTDIDRVFNEYLATLKPHLDAGKTIIFVLNHQTWGEGQNQWWEHNGWMPPESPRWVTQFAPAYANFIGQIVAQWRPYGDQIIWQVWNEQDSLAGRASVVLSPSNYGVLFGQVARAIKTVIPNATVITGGHNSGPGLGVQYLEQTLRTLTSNNYPKPDGVAIHPYGRGRVGEQFAPYGSIRESLKAYRRFKIPLWITEFGVLDHGASPDQHVADYVRGFIEDCSHHNVQAAVYFAWGKQDDGHPVFDNPLLREVLTGGVTTPESAKKELPPIRPVGQGEPQPSTQWTTPVGTEMWRPKNTTKQSRYYDVTGHATWYTMPGTQLRQLHTGVDLNSGANDLDKGEPVFAIADGVVVFAGWASDAWGNIIVIDHGDVVARYAHVENVSVGQGERVVVGETVAGISNANGRWESHLHFDMTHTKLLANNPFHWAGEDEDIVASDYVDPYTFLQSKGVS